MCEVLDRVEARGKARGEARGEARGVIKGAIIMCCEDMGLTRTETAGKIMERFGLDEEEAEKYLEQVLGPQQV